MALLCIVLVRKLVLGDSVWALYREKENAGYSADVFARRWDCQESGYSCSAVFVALSLGSVRVR